MILNKFAVAGLLAALTLPSFGALAQEATTPAEPAPQITETDTSVTVSAPSAADPKNNWLKLCDPLDDGKKVCVMRQVVMSTGGQFLGSFLLRDDPGQESRLLAVAAVPLGVLLPFGLTWQIDGGKPVRVPFMLCDPSSCATQLVINEAYVNSLKKGGVLKLTAKNRQNKDLVIDINLSGFTSAYDGEANMTFEEFNQESSGSTALQKSTDDLAEQLRRRLEEGQAAPAADGTTPAAPAQ
ncbi:invasion associated locus B family protein [Devosia sp.]|jgi:invasion protein IalB|uniref:invasion associated locus B family protein n=1 Tax=Devosia sp. TaxID=1871048 RepID=UPI0037BF8189